MTSSGLTKGSAATVQSAFAIDSQKWQCPKDGREYDLGGFACRGLAELSVAAWPYWYYSSWAMHCKDSCYLLGSSSPSSGDVPAS